MISGSESEFLVDFPTLGDLGDAWIAQHARVPDGFQRGKPFVQADWQFWCTANHYRVRADAQWVPERPMLNQAFTYRRSQIVGPQKLGKGPWTATIAALEAVGPAVFAGWAGKGDGYACSDHGCGCGWEYPYLAGEPMGRRHPSPLIQLTAISQDQVNNVWRPLRAMISSGPLSDLLLQRHGFIKIVGEHADDLELDRIDQVTSAPNSRVGNPISFAAQDESGLATKANKMVDVYETQRRGAAGMGGRTMETTNPWDPAVQSTAQRTFEANADDVFIYYRRPPEGLKYRERDDRRRIHEFVYFGSPWVNLDSIEGEASELLKTDAAQAERFFGNRVVAGSGSWFEDMASWQGKIRQFEVAPRTKVGAGFDGSDNDDFTGIRLETLDQFQFTPRYGDARRPTLWKPQDWGGRIPKGEVMAAWDDIANQFEIVRAYLDPPMWETEIDELAAKHGDKVFIGWPTYRVAQMTAELDRFRTDIENPESAFTHDGDEQVAVHIRNAIVRARKLDAETKRRLYVLGKASEGQKIDFAMSSVLAHAAAMDAIAAGMNQAADEYAYVF